MILLSINTQFLNCDTGTSILLIQGVANLSWKLVNQIESGNIDVYRQITLLSPSPKKGLTLQ